jgi:hypothetical protein
MFAPWPNLCHCPRVGILKFAQTAWTVLKETFAAPACDSYVLRSGDTEIVLRQGGDYPRVDLSGYDLSGLDLHGTNLSGANLSAANLTNTNLAGANLKATDLDGAIVDNTKFDDAMVEGANLHHMSFASPPPGLFVPGEVMAR